MSEKKGRTPKITAPQVIELLRARHSKDVFVSECKNGPTQVYGAQVLKLDAWAMPRSWSNPACTGYEVKVSRSDFLRDDKWPGYLECCNCFYFVAPPGIIMKDELPPEVGLVETSRNAAKLYTRKKAPVRDIQIPEELFRYVLMCRAKITDEIANRSQADYWRRWMAEKDENKSLGWNVSEKIQTLVREGINEQKRRNDSLQFQVEQLEGVRELLGELGIEDLNSYQLKRRAGESAREAFFHELPKDLVGTINQLSTALGFAKSVIEKHQGVTR